MKLLLALFGHSAVYIVGASLVVVIVLIAWALWQGRSVTVCQVTIGAQRRRGSVRQIDQPSAAEVNKDRSTSPQDQQIANVARVYHVCDAAKFYQEIAPNYDQRNSVNLLATHMEVITRIDQARRIKPGLHVLDLGGGTGQNVATYFFNDRCICWTYVDFCPVMADQLQQHLAGRPLYENLSVHVEDLNRIQLRVLAKPYDIALLSLVLSSMPELPDFTRIARLLAPGGQLIIADANPLYTSAHPYYKATAADGILVAMRTRPVQLLEVVTRAREAGLKLSEMAEIGSDSISHSFIVTFATTARPDEDNPSWDRDLLPA